MPRKAVLSAAQQAALTALPSANHDLRLRYTLSENDLAIIRSKRGPHNRLGFAIQLYYLRFPGQAMTLEAEPSAELLAHVAQQIQVAPDAWIEYASRDETRREHALELQSVFGYRAFTIAEYRRLRGWLTDLALQTNKALALAEQLIESLRSQRVIVPAVTMIDRLCAEALARGVTNQILDMHDRIVGRMFNEAKRKHEQSFAESRGDQRKGAVVRSSRSSVDRRTTKRARSLRSNRSRGGLGPLTQSVDEAKRLAEPESFDHLHLLTESYGQVRRYAPALLETFDFGAAPAIAPLLAAIDTLRAMNRRNARKVPDDAPTGFLRPRWKPYVLTETTITRLFQASPSRNAKSSVCAPRHQILPVPLAGAPPGGISVPISGPGA